MDTTFDTTFDTFDTFITSFDNEFTQEDVFQHEEIQERDVVIDVNEEDKIVVDGEVVTEVETLERNDSQRKSTRISKQPDYFGEWVNVAVENTSDPRTYKQAMKSTLSENWKKAMEEEFNSLKSHKTWELVDMPSNSNLVGCKWVYKTKRKADGTVDRFKARLVAQGYSQEEGIDFDEVFAPVAKV